MTERRKVRFAKKWLSYVPGDVYSFDARYAALLIEQGIADEVVSKSMDGPAMHKAILAPEGKK
jgi:hypothetical protein